MNNKVFPCNLHLIILILFTIVMLLPEVLRERIFPYDGALFAANGIFFLSILNDFSNFISSPTDWIWQYYHQYPALFIRRHPPIFGLIESAMFAVFGISAVTAKLTVLLFAIFFVIGWFLALRRFISDELVTFFSVLLTISLPWFLNLGSVIMLDIPSMSFFAWGLYFLSKMELSEKKYRYAILTAILFSCSLYTYQLTIFGIIASFLFMLKNGKKNLLKKSEFYIFSFTLISLILPLAIFTLKFASDNLIGFGGKLSEEFLPFIPVRSIWNIENWLFYLSIIINSYTVPFIGILLWGISKTHVSFRKNEFLFLLWFLIGYFGFSILPSKVPRYAFHFVIAAMPLTVIGIRDNLQAVFNKLLLRKHSLKLQTILILIMFCWNISTIGEARGIYAEGFDRVANYIIKKNESGNILYNGQFESAFIFYIREFDVDRMFRVFRAGNEFVEPEKLIDDMNEKRIDLLVYESIILRKDIGSVVYQRFLDKMNLIVQRNKNFFIHLEDFKVLFGKPGKEKAILLKVYKLRNVN